MLFNLVNCFKETVLKCPIDGSFLEVGRAEEHTGYGCATCKGSWLPKKYINSIKYSKDFDPQQFFTELSTNTSGHTDKRCPSSCGLLSAVKNLDGIDYCSVCHGVWFEKDSLKTVFKRLRNKESHLNGVDTPNLTVGFFDFLGFLFK